MFCKKICFLEAGAGRSRAFIGGDGAETFYLEPESKKKYIWSRAPQLWPHPFSLAYRRAVLRLHLTGTGGGSLPLDTIAYRRAVLRLHPTGTGGGSLPLDTAALAHQPVYQFTLFFNTQLGFFFWKLFKTRHSYGRVWIILIKWRDQQPRNTLKNSWFTWRGNKGFTEILLVTTSLNKNGRLLQNFEEKIAEKQ